MKGRFVPLSIAIFGLIWLVAGCQTPKKPATKEEKKPEVVAEKKQPKEEAVKEKDSKRTEESTLTDDQKKLVVAKINDKEITLADLEKHFNNQPPYARARYSTHEAKKEFLDNLVRFELLAVEAEKKGYAEDVDVQFARKQQMIKKLMINDVQGLVKLEDITDEEMKKFYDENLNLYNKSEQVRVSQILVKDQKAANEALQKLKAEVAKDPKQVRKVFADFVKEYSVDEESKKFNGDLRYLSKEGAADPNVKVPTAVIDAAFKMTEVNQISEVIPSDGGFHILMLTHKRPAIDRKFEEVKQQIQNKLFRDKKEQSQNKFIEDLRSNAKVELFEEHLALIKDMPDVPKPELDQLNPSLDKQKLDPHKITPETAIRKGPHQVAPDQKDEGTDKKGPTDPSKIIRMSPKKKVETVK